MKFAELVKIRQSDRKYKNQEVEKEKILQCLETARLSPSANNSQPWKFVVVDDVEKKESELEMLEQLVSLTGITQHKGLLNLDQKPVMHNRVCEKDQISATVQNILGL